MSRVLPRPPARRSWAALALLAAVAVGAWVGVAGCGALDRALDRRALAGKARLATAQEFPGDRGPPPFRTAAELEELTRPRGVPNLQPVDGPPHRLDREGIVQEELVFDSAIHLRHPESNRAQLWIYRHGPLGERPVVLWVPGLYVSEVAFRFIDRFIGAALDLGADVAFYVPPYHLGRAPAGFDSGDAVLATDFPDHLAVSAQEISDLRALVLWLRSRGVSTLGAFAGSMGANIVLRIITWEPAFDFATLLIPLIRWDDVTLEAPEMAPVRRRVHDAGWEKEALAEVYRALDPTPDAPRMPAAKLSVLYGRWDQVARVGPLLRWADAWGVTRLRACDSGHTLILLNGDVYRDYRELLGQDLATLPGQRPGRPPVSVPPETLPARAAPLLPPLR